MKNSTSRFLLLLGVVMFLFASGARGQSTPNYHSAFPYPDSVQNGRLWGVAGGVGGFYVLGNAYLGVIWYKDHNRVPFHTYDDNAGWLQIDKMGHAFGAYHYSAKGYDALRWAGLPHGKALAFGGPLGLVLQTPIEIFDGLYEGYGFSWGDMIANTSGAALFSAQQWFWEDQIVKMKWSYYPSPYPEIYPFYLGQGGFNSVFRDYNAHTYWLSANMNKMVPIEAIPDWLNLAFGYSANGMLREFDNPTWFYQGNYLGIPRTRQYILSLDVDLSKVPARNRWLRAALKTLNLFKVPAPAIEYNAEQGLVLHWLYY